MSAVESVLQVDASLSDQVVASHQVVVVDQDRQQRLLRELRLDLKGPGRRSSFRSPVSVKWKVSWWPTGGHVPPEHRIQLLGNVVVPVFDFILAEPKDNVRVRFPVRVGRVQV